MVWRISLLGATLATLLGCVPEVVPSKVPEGLGVNIHFTGAPARDLDMIQAAGFRAIRMDFVWSAVEKKKGEYDFAPYDQLTDALQARGIRPLYILDYSNKLYETDRSVRTEEGRQAFARFAATAAKRYRGRGIIWELWNEPNIGFWQPQPSVDDYMKLAWVTLPAVKKADPSSLCVAPATSGIPLDFLEECFRRGLLDLVDAVTVHPYRQTPPETVKQDILKLRALIARFRPDQPNIPIFSGEWGYSVAWHGYDEQRQGQYLPRQFLTNLSLGIPLSIWYDWHDDGKDPKNPEHNFGTVRYDYTPKPAYLAMQRLVKALSGMSFVKRLHSAPEDYLLLFSDGQRHCLAAWTTAAASTEKRFELMQDPQYVPVKAGDRAIEAEAAWTVKVRSVGVRGGAKPGEPLSPQFEVRVRNPFRERIKVNFSTVLPEGLVGEFVGRSAFELLPSEEKRLVWKGYTHRRDTGELYVEVKADVGGFQSTQEVTFIITNPIVLGVAPIGQEGMRVWVRNLSDDPFSGDLLVMTDAKSAKYPVKLEGYVAKTGEAVYIPVEVKVKWGAATVRAQLREGKSVVADSGALRFVPLTVNTKTARAVNDGDAKVPATFELSDDKDIDLGPVLRFTYDYGKGWKFVRIAPTQLTAVEGAPHAIGAWVCGDGSDCTLNMRFVDSRKCTFQSNFGRMNFTGWRFLTAQMDNPKMSHWGGEGEYTGIAYPIRIDTFILVDSKREPVKGQVRFGGFYLIYTEDKR